MYFFKIQLLLKVICKNIQPNNVVSSCTFYQKKTKADVKLKTKCKMPTCRHKSIPRFTLVSIYFLNWYITYWKQWIRNFISICASLPNWNKHSFLIPTSLWTGWHRGVISGLYQHSHISDITFCQTVYVNFVVRLNVRKLVCA